MRRYLKAALRRTKQWLDEVDKPGASGTVLFDNTYAWLNNSFLRLMRDAKCSAREQYIWGVLQGVALAKVLGLKKISVIEFGVAGGAGLLALERIAERAEEMTGIGIGAYGFDTGSGLPKPQDYRDSPNLWLGEGQFPMERERLEKRLRRASLILGLIATTLPTFLRSLPAPVAFVSFDIDLYSSTRDALRLFDAEHDRLMPRIVCYFDDIIGLTYSDFNGERLSISEFNASHAMRKLSPIYGLKYFVPPGYGDASWMDLLYFAHIFDHPLYNRPDQIRKPMIMDIEDNITGLRLAKDPDRA